MSTFSSCRGETHQQSSGTAEVPTSELHRSLSSSQKCIPPIHLRPLNFHIRSCLKKPHQKDLDYLEVRFSTLIAAQNGTRSISSFVDKDAEIKRNRKNNLPERGISLRRAVSCEEDELARLQKRGLHEMEKTEDPGDGADKPGLPKLPANGVLQFAAAPEIDRHGNEENLRNIPSPTLPLPPALSL